jgi:3-oxoacyl-[acyl-carrier protein] reductase
MSERPVALVTGSTANIGRAIAVRLARDGFDLVINGRAPDWDGTGLAAELEGSGARFRYIGADVGDEAAIARLFDEAATVFGRLDVLVNNAAARAEVSFDDMTLADWRGIVNVQLDGLFLCTKAALPLLRRSDRGRIVNIGGLSAHIGARNRAHVVTTKAAVLGFSRALARDLATDGITVNTVVPGRIDTTRAGPVPVHAAVPAGERMGRPEEVAEAVAMLCSRNGAYMTGQTLHVNGGAYLGA